MRIQMAVVGQTRSTVSRHNAASLRSPQAVADFAVIAELPNDYLLIEFPRVGRGTAGVEHTDATSESFMTA